MFYPSLDIPFLPLCPPPPLSSCPRGAQRTCCSPPHPPLLASHFCFSCPWVSSSESWPWNKSGLFTVRSGPLTLSSNSMHQSFLVQYSSPRNALKQTNKDLKHSDKTDKITGVKAGSRCLQRHLMPLTTCSHTTADAAHTAEPPPA